MEIFEMKHSNAYGALSEQEESVEKQIKIGSFWGKGAEAEMGILQYL